MGACAWRAVASEARGRRVLRGGQLIAPTATIISVST
jgi:hypothetical protein